MYYANIICYSVLDSNVFQDNILFHSLLHNDVFVSTAATVFISLERNSYTISESSGFVEVCVILEGLGVEEDKITVEIFTESSTATGKQTSFAGNLNINRVVVHNIDFEV